MASKHTKIQRTITEFKYFLDYYEDEYKDAFINIRPDKGLELRNVSDKVFDLINKLYNNLYDNIYPKLLVGNPATDEELLIIFNGTLMSLENFIVQFQQVPDKDVLSLWESIVYQLADKAIYKLREVIQLANDDLKSFTIAKKDTIIGIVTATLDEHKAVKQMISDGVIVPKDGSDSNIYYEGFFEKSGKKIRVVLTSTHHQGMAASSNTTTKLLLKFVPSMLFMIGHQAGNKNRKDLLKLGDIVVGDESVDYHQSEVIQKNGNTPSIVEKDKKISVHINSGLKAELMEFGHDFSLLSSIKEGYKDRSIFKHELKVHVGKIVSGGILLRSNDRFEEIIKENSGLFGLDMETYGFYYACQNSFIDNIPKFASIKSISDYGEHNTVYDKEVASKSVRQEYACYTSARFVFEFVMKNYCDN